MEKDNGFDICESNHHETVHTEIHFPNGSSWYMDGEKWEKARGKKPLNTSTLIRIMEKNRNRFASVKREDRTWLVDGLSFWFSTRPISSL